MKVRVLLDKCVKKISLEEYIGGVVAAEMPASWHMEALKAQSIVARTYAVHAHKNPRHMRLASHLCATTHCQEYLESAVNHSVSQAVYETRSKVIGSGRCVINAVYSSACGGYTLSSEEVWGIDFSYTKSVRCPCNKEKNGHGVGMCQHGAQALACRGFDCYDIISFFYANVDIIMI